MKMHKLTEQLNMLKSAICSDAGIFKRQVIELSLLVNDEHYSVYHCIIIVNNAALCNEKKYLFLTYLHIQHAFTSSFPINFMSLHFSSAEFYLQKRQHITL